MIRIRTRTMSLAGARRQLLSTSLNPSSTLLSPSLSPGTTTTKGSDTSSELASPSSISYNNLENSIIPAPAPPIETMYNGIVERQQDKIRKLEAALAEINRNRLNQAKTTNARGKNVTRLSSKVSMTMQDTVNQQHVAGFLREFVWPSQKILPKHWTKYREAQNSLCQMILRKVNLPCGVDGKTYWDSMLLGIVNDKYCSLRSNFKQELFEQFQGKSCKIFKNFIIYANT